VLNMITIMIAELHGPLVTSVQTGALRLGLPGGGTVSAATTIH